MLPSCAEFSADELRLLFGEDASRNAVYCHGVSTDSRTVKPGELFIALSGELFDGHQFIDSALSRGATAAIVERSRIDVIPDAGQPLIFVENTLVALGEIARFHRLRFNIPVVAIAGAAGKTSTKDITAHILARRFNVLKTEKNYNNRIGVPLTLLSMTQQHTAAVIEIGTNEPGEIAALSRILHPTHGLITNIGKEHLEKLRDLDGVEREECALFEFLLGNKGNALINQDDSRLAKYHVSMPNTLSFGLSDNAQLHAKVEFDRFLHPILTLYHNGENSTARMQTLGQTAALNAVAAASIAHALGMNLSEISTSLETYSPPPVTGYGRMAMEKRQRYIIINDTYNANPESVMSALKTLRDFPTAGRKIAVLGDMRELGETSAIEHDEILRAAADSADYVIVVGTEMSSGALRLGIKTITISEKSTAADRVLELLSDESVVLVKGSRGMAMEDIVALL